MKIKFLEPHYDEWEIINYSRPAAYYGLSMGHIQFKADPEAIFPTKECIFYILDGDNIILKALGAWTTQHSNVYTFAIHKELPLSFKEIAQGILK